ncbi:MAG: YgeY family selenium metabolism-linked hydrolase [Synergistales bacterium]|nr:YgeY family selenium metabolism-linked hydrolase [Synergistales bacterium]
MSIFLEKAEAYREDMVRFLSELTKIPSYSGKERDAVEMVRRKMEDLGFADVHVDGLGNVLGRVGSGERIIAFDGHLDVVDPGNRELWEKEPFSGFVDDQWVYGRGTVDQKSGFVAALYGMKILKELGCPPGISLYLVGSVMEEDCDGLCWKYIVQETGLKPDTLVVTEPSDLKIMRGQRGRVEFKIVVKGSSAHASMPEKGDNAVYKMCRLVMAIESLDRELSGEPPLGKGSVVVSSIDSLAPSLNAVPDHCEIYIDRRLTSGESKETVFSQIKDILNRIGIQGHIVEQTFDGSSYRGVSFPMEKYYPSWLQDENSREVLAARKAYLDVFHGSPDVDCWKFSTNGTVAKGFFNIPCIGFGPGDPGMAHVPNERVNISDLVKASAFYSALPFFLDGKGQTDPGKE